MCEDYRASAPTRAPDLHLDRLDRQAGSKIHRPTRVLWGRKGVIQAMWQNCCAGKVEGSALECGHYVPEEKPGEVLEEVRVFFK